MLVEIRDSPIQESCLWKQLMLQRKARAGDAKTYHKLFFFFFFILTYRRVFFIILWIYSKGQQKWILQVDFTCHVSNDFTFLSCRAGEWPYTCDLVMMLWLHPTQACQSWPKLFFTCETRAVRLPLLLLEANTEKMSPMKISQAEEFHRQTQTCCAAGHECSAQHGLMGQTENHPEIALKYSQHHHDKCCFLKMMHSLKTD